MGDPQKPDEDRREIPIDIIPDILLKLPTKDFVRSSCVCKPWRSIVADASVRKLHVAHDAAASSSEPAVLLVTETRRLGWSDEASVFNLSSAKALCHVDIPSGYRLAGVCNDLLCFAHDHEEAPAIVCNPVTGETLRLPEAPPLRVWFPEMWHLFVLGFSRRTMEYKMFRISFPRWYDQCRDETSSYIFVYTLVGGGGGGGGWRQCSYLSRFHPVTSPATVHIDGNIFVPTGDLADKRARAARMLVLDVATETHRSYRIPYGYGDCPEAWDGTLADGFDLNGQMCLVVNPQPPKKMQFWVMKLPGDEGEVVGAMDDDDADGKLYLGLRYSFSFDGLRDVWIDDHAQTLCYRIGRFVYKYDTSGYASSSSDVVDSLVFDERLELPYYPCPAPAVLSQCLQFRRWRICGGYRPSLLSPLVFALPPFQGEKGKKRPHFEHTLLQALNVELDEHMDGTGE